ncbi:helix-hairpin-helix domain-containing protein [Thermostilla marina]
MITKITGKLVRLTETAATIAVGGFEYEVLVPEFTRRGLQGELGTEVALHTLEFLDGNPNQGRMVPRLIGFNSEVEREFFEMICSVDGLGTKKALRAMVRPVQDIATAIEEQDTKYLSGLPGVGPAMADRIVAKLRRKMSKFALLVGRGESVSADSAPSDVVSETYEILITLGHSEADARRLLDAALSGGKKYKSSEALLHAVYQQSHT